jgi:hypothetical protein
MEFVEVAMLFAPAAKLLNPNALLEFPTATAPLFSA